MRRFSRNCRDRCQDEEQRKHCIRSRGALAADQHSNRPHSSDKQRAKLEGRGCASKDRDQFTFDQRADEKPIMILGLVRLLKKCEVEFMENATTNFELPAYIPA